MNDFETSEQLLQEVALDRPGLIEASAGTGKTTLITGLFLRALLEQEECTIERLLVVTFTNAATAELVDRVRDLLYDVLGQIEKNRPPKDKNKWTTGLLDRAKTRLEKSGADPGEIDRILQVRIRDAIDRIGQAQIQTIHSFCLKVLSEFALETGLPFDRTLVTDSKEEWLTALETVFRTHIEGGPVPFVHYLLERKLSTGKDLIPWTPESFYTLLRPYESILARSTDTGKAMDPDEGAEAPILETLRKLEEALRVLWSTERETVRTLLGDGRLNGNKYRRNAIETFPAWFDRELEHPLFLVRRVCESRQGKTDEHQEPSKSTWEKWGARTLNASLKAKREPFEHAFFALIDEVADASRELMALWEVRVGKTIRKMVGDLGGALDRQKKKRKIAFHEDLLIDLLKVLRDPSSGPRLIERLSEHYRLVLIDEFQDTDPVQTEIFERWDGARKTPLILVGDPKQSIYRFRGADLNAYVAFRNRFLGDIRSLWENFRSSPRLLESFNRLFAAHGNPFLTPGIDYVRLRSRGEDRNLTSHGIPFPSIRFWGKGSGAETLSKTALKERLAKETALGIARFLGDGSDIRLDGKPVSPEAIAVLVRTNDEGANVRRELSKLGIPASLESQESVYQTREALGLDWILRAVWDPGDEGKRIMALASELIGWNAEEIDAVRRRVSEWERIAVEFAGFRQIWSRHGVYPMFLRLWKAYGIDGRLDRRSGGSRIRTNTRHLLELLNEAERTQRLSPERLIAHFAKERTMEGSPGEEEFLRPEPGPDHVRILTVHKAKGLGFDIVFCPYLWEPVSAWRDGFIPDLIYREGAEGGFRVACEIEKRDRDSLVRSDLAEQIRLFYVALTRAKVHVTLYWDPGLLDNAKFLLSGSSWIFQGYPFSHESEGLETEKALFERVRLGMMHREADARSHDFESLLERLGEEARWMPFDPEPSGPAVGSPVEEDSSGPEETCPRVAVPRGWEVTSFTRLAAFREGEFPEERPGLDESLSPVLESGTGLPGGTRTGTMLHKILERVDFEDPGSLSVEVPPILESFGFQSEEWLPDVVRRLTRVFDTPLPPGTDFRLRDLPRRRTIREMEFSLPVRSFLPDDLWHLLRANGIRVPGTPGFSPEWDRRIKGFLNGTLDLVFLRDGRYSIADYKSNNLGASKADYAHDRLEDAMEREGYSIQAFLYALALHRYLSGRISGYDYDRHVGEVFYLFLRGMNPGSHEGVYTWRFPKSMVLEGESLLNGGTGEPFGQSGGILLRRPS